MSLKASTAPRRRLIWAALAVTTVLLSGATLASEDETRRLTGTLSGEQVVAGESVRLHEATLGDLFVAGGEVSADRVTAEDVIAAGGSLRFMELAARDLIAAGGEIDLEGTLSEDLIAAGGRLFLRAGSRVAGYAVLAGGDVELEGRIDGNVKIAGGRVRVGGEIGGDLDVVAGRLSIAPGARIGGALAYRSGEAAEIAPDAVIAGGIERHEFDVERPSAGAIVAIVSGIAGVVLLGLALLGVALHAAVPELLVGAAAAMRTRFWAALGLGFALLIATPVAANLVLVTVVGIPLAVFAFLIYAALLPAAAVTAGYWAGGGLARAIGWSYGGEPLGWRMLWTLAGLVVLGLVAVIPLLGALLATAALALGLGGLALQLWRMLEDWGRRPHAERPLP